jgi:glutaredoxin-related protein
LITFFFTYKDIGGVQALIFNLMKELFDNNIRTKLIYHNNSWLTEELDRNCIDYEFFNIEEIKTQKLDKFIHNDDILVTTILFMELVYFRKINPSFLLWNVASFTFEFNNDIFKLIRRLTRKELIKKMIRKNGLVFMDNEGVQFIEKMFGIEFGPRFLPVPISICSDNKFIQRRNIHKENIDITYLGRAVELKVNPVLKVIKDIYNCNPESKQIVLHIITDDIDRFRRIMNNPVSGFVINFYSGLSGSELRQFLAETSDLHIAMGTSCLEGSSLGIPSILVDASHKEFPGNYLYRWIFENDNFCLGKILEDSVKFTVGRPISEILSYYDENKSEELAGISKLCYEYTQKNHSLKNITREFYNSCMNSKLKIRDVLNTDLSHYLMAMVKNKAL